MEVEESIQEGTERPKRAGPLRSSPARVLVLAFVPVELLLQIGLGVFQSRECAERSLELLATCSAGSDTRHRTNVLNDSDSAFRNGMPLSPSKGNGEVASQFLA